MAQKHKASSSDLPLLDEVNELIEKERLLLSLKVLEQKQEAEEWKLKYDTLVGKVSTNADQTGLDHLQLAADIVNETQLKNISVVDLDHIITNQVYPWIFDMSQIKIDSTTFANLTKRLFTKHSTESDSFTVAIFRDCGFTDNFSTAVSTVFRNSQIFAVDISHNELNEMFFLQLVPILKDRRKSPQYLLLDANSPLAESVKHFPALLDVLTNDLWGLTVSLPDFTDLVFGHKNLNNTTQKKTTKGGLMQEYKDPVKHPMKAFEFLTALNKLMDISGDAHNIGADGKKKKKPTIKKQKSERLNPLQSLSVLGLTYFHLSKKSIMCLESTLTLTAPTLIDLDLSFAYVGSVGAEMLRRVLSSTDCQITTLTLTGNAIGDDGLESVCRSLMVNKTLTYLDARSNSVTDLGLLAIESYLCHNTIMYMVDLRDNYAITDSAMYVLCTALSDSVSCVQVKTSGLSSGDILRRAKASHPNLNTLLYEQTRKVKRTVALDRSALMFSVDMTQIHAIYPSRMRSKKCFQWRWRSVQTSLSSNVLQKVQTHVKQNISSSSSNSNNKSSRLNRSFDESSSKNSHAHPSSVLSSGDDAYLFLSQYTICYELRVSAGTYEHDDSRLSMSSSSVLTRRLFADIDTTAATEWCQCSHVFHSEELPEKGSVDIYVTLLDRQGNKITNSNGACVVFEGKDLIVSAVTDTDEYHLPCGYQGECDGKVLNQRLSSKHMIGADIQLKLLADDRGEVLHCQRWGNITCDDLTVSFDLKLCATDSVMSPDNAGKAAPQHESLGYEWFVLLIRDSGTITVLASGLSSSGVNGDEVNVENAVTYKLLQAWSWRHCSAALKRHTLCADDLLVLTARALSSQHKYPPALLKKCSVALRAFQVTSKLSAKGSYHLNREVDDDEEEIVNKKVTNNNDDRMSSATLSALTDSNFGWSSHAIQNDSSCYFPM